MDSNVSPIQPIAIAAPGATPSPLSEPAIRDVDFAAHVLRHAERLATVLTTRWLRLTSLPLPAVLDRSGRSAATR